MCHYKAVLSCSCVARAVAHNFKLLQSIIFHYLDILYDDDDKYMHGIFFSFVSFSSPWCAFYSVVFFAAAWVKYIHWVNTYMAYFFSLLSLFLPLGVQIFTARRYAIAVYAVVACLSICPSIRTSVCLSHADIVPKRLNVGSCKQLRTIAQRL